MPSNSQRHTPSSAFVWLPVAAVLTALYLLFGGSTLSPIVLLVISAVAFLSVLRKKHALVYLLALVTFVSTAMTFAVHVVQYLTGGGAIALWEWAWLGVAALIVTALVLSNVGNRTAGLWVAGASVVAAICLLIGGIVSTSTPQDTTKTSRIFPISSIESGDGGYEVSYYDGTVKKQVTVPGDSVKGDPSAMKEIVFTKTCDSSGMSGSACSTTTTLQGAR